MTTTQTAAEFTAFVTDLIARKADGQRITETRDGYRVEISTTCVGLYALDVRGPQNTWTRRRDVSKHNIKRIAAELHAEIVEQFVPEAPVPAKPRTTPTAGQKLTATLTKTLYIGSRTRNRRGPWNLRDQMVETVQTAATIPGYWTAERQQAMATGYTAINSYRKHIEGGRVDSIVCWYVREGMSPYQFAKLLGRMVDAGIKTVYEAEAFFGSMRAEANAAYAKRY